MAMVRIRIFECRDCGRQTTRPEMPEPARRGWVTACPCSSGFAPAAVRAARIEAADLRYLERFKTGKGNLDVTGFAEAD